ncbi:hypothetical protein U9M48_024384, partial [Paspalum notatum var. saurae]
MKVAAPNGDEDREPPVKEAPKSAPHEFYDSTVLPFPLRQKKASVDDQFGKFVEVIKKLYVNIPLLDAMQVPTYAKYMKDILNNKKPLPSTKVVHLMEECSAAILNKPPKKKKDPGNPSISCSIKTQYFDQALYDLGASVSVMPKETPREKIELSPSKPKMDSLLVAMEKLLYDGEARKLKADRRAKSLGGASLAQPPTTESGGKASRQRMSSFFRKAKKALSNIGKGLHLMFPSSADERSRSRSQSRSSRTPAASDRTLAHPTGCLSAGDEKAQALQALTTKAFGRTKCFDAFFLVEIDREPPVKEAPNSPPHEFYNSTVLPFPLRLKKASVDDQFGKFVEVIKKLYVNIPLLDAMQVPTYAKYLKDILNNKKPLPSTKVVHLMEECSAAILNKTPKKKKDPGNPSISCSIRTQNFDQALCDLGASVSVMPKVVFDKLTHATLAHTAICLPLVDQSIRYPVGIAEDVPVKIRNFIVPMDFVVLDMEVDTKTLLILGRPFLSTAEANIDVGAGEVHLNINDRWETFAFKPK